MTQLTVSNLAEIPRGVYRGSWGGYCVVFAVGPQEYEGTTEVGIRCIDCPCTVTIGEDGATVELDN